MHSIVIEMGGIGGPLGRTIVRACYRFARRHIIAVSQNCWWMHQPLDRRDLDGPGDWQYLF